MKYLYGPLCVEVISTDIDLSPSKMEIRDYIKSIVPIDGKMQIEDVIKIVQKRYHVTNDDVVEMVDSINMEFHGPDGPDVFYDNKPIEEEPIGK